MKTQKQIQQKNEQISCNFGNKRKGGKIKMNEKIRKYVFPVVVGASMMCSLFPNKVIAQDIKQKENRLEVEIGYNALEIGLTNNGNLRSRFLGNVDVQYKNFEVGFHGLNELTGDLKEYFGRNVLTAGLKDKNWKFTGVFKANLEGIFDKKYGLRFNVNNNLGVDYGWVDIVFNQDGRNITSFVGKSLGDKTKVELFNSVEIPFGEKLSIYTEVQLNRKIKDDLSIYARGEMAGVKYKDAVYLIGITKKF